MEKQTELTHRELSAYMSEFLDSQYYAFRIIRIADIEFVNGFTVATIEYTAGTEHVHTRRWSFRREDWDNRIIAYFHDESQATR